MDLQANSFLCHISVVIMLYFTKEVKDFLRYGCEFWWNSSSTTYFANEVYLTLPMKYYFYRPCITTSFSHPFNAKRADTS